MMLPMTQSRTTPRPAAVAAATASGVLLVLALSGSSTWLVCAAILVLIANVVVGLRQPESRNIASAGAIVAALAIAAPPLLG